MFRRPCMSLPTEKARPFAAFCRHVHIVLYAWLRGVAIYGRMGVATDGAKGKAVSAAFAVSSMASLSAAFGHNTAYPFQCVRKRSSSSALRRPWGGSHSSMWVDLPPRPSSRAQPRADSALGRRPQRSCSSAGRTCRVERQGALRRGRQASGRVGHLGIRAALWWAGAHSRIEESVPCARLHWIVGCGVS